MEIGCVYIVIAAQTIMARNEHLYFTFYELIGLSIVTVPHAAVMHRLWRRFCLSERHLVKAKGSETLLSQLISNRDKYN